MLGKCACFDNGGTTMDRYTVVLLDHPQTKRHHYDCMGLSDNCDSPQGFNQMGVAFYSKDRGNSHLGKNILFTELPEVVKASIHRRLRAP